MVRISCRMWDAPNTSSAHTSISPKRCPPNWAPYHRGLLGDERVRADATCVHLVFDHVAEFEHVDDAYGSGLVEAFAGTAVVEICLAVAWYACLIGPVVEVVERGAVEKSG